MPRFTVIPSDRPNFSAEITALDGGAVLNVVGQLACEEADILQDGRYAFSVRLSSSGMWTIFQRPIDTEPQDITSYG